MKNLILLPLIMCLAQAPLLLANSDALAPLSTSDEALTGPLHTVTVSTNSLRESLLFYRDAMGLSVEGPLKHTPDEIAERRALWGVPENVSWQTYRLYRPELPEVIQIRLLVIQEQTQAIHSSWSALELGPFSMGFPNLNQIAQDQKVRQLGFGALNKIEIYDVPRPDGSRYPIHETIFNGPDFVHGVGIYRGDGMSQLGPVDAHGLGGPAYSAMVVEDSDSMLAFLTDVLGLELRSDRIWESAGTEGALNVPDGTIFRFSIVYSPGATSGHLLFVDYQNREAIDPGVAPRIPHRGIGLWSFPVKSLDEVLKRASDHGAAVIHPPVDYQSSTMGAVKAASVRAPNGFTIELFETREAR